MKTVWKADACSLKGGDATGPQKNELKSLCRLGNFRLPVYEPNTRQKTLSFNPSSSDLKLLQRVLSYTCTRVAARL